MQSLDPFACRHTQKKTRGEMQTLAGKSGVVLGEEVQTPESLRLSFRLVHRFQDQTEKWSLGCL